MRRDSEAHSTLPECAIDIEERYAMLMKEEERVKEKWKII